MRFLLMLAVTGGIVFGILKFRGRLERVYKGYKVTDESLVAGSADGTEAPSVGGTSKMLRSARPEIAGAAMTSLEINTECKGYIADLQKLDLIALDRNHYQVSYQQLPVKPDDCAFNDPNLSAIIRTLATKCKATVSQSETINDSCAAALFMARAATTKKMFGQRPLSSIEDIRILTDLMFAEFGSVNNQSLPDLKRAKAVADRMQELNPNLYVAAKVVAFAEVIEGLNVKASKTQMLAEEWTAAAHAVARAKELNPNDESLRDAEMLIATRGFEPKLAIGYADKLITSDPSNAKAWYIKAYAEWKLGNRQNAMMNLKKAATLAPENKTYSRTYHEASRPNARSDAFQGSITFGVDSNDFDK